MDHPLEPRVCLSVSAVESQNRRSWRVLETPSCMHTSNWVIDTWGIWEILRRFTDLSVMVDSILPVHSGKVSLLKYYPVQRCDMGKWRNLPTTLQKINVPGRGPWRAKKRHHNMKPAVVKIRYCPVRLNTSIDHWIERKKTKPSH